MARITQIIICCFEDKICVLLVQSKVAGINLNEKWKIKGRNLYQQKYQ